MKPSIAYRSLESSDVDDPAHDDDDDRADPLRLARHAVLAEGLPEEDGQGEGARAREGGEHGHAEEELHGAEGGAALVEPGKSIRIKHRKALTLQG